MGAKSIWSILKQAGAEWVANKAPRLGAALAYYTIFSLAPLLIIAIGVAGLVFGRSAAEKQIGTQVESLVGQTGGEAIQAMLESASRPGSGLVGSILGVAMLLFGAAGLFGQLQDALNTIWGVEPKPGRGIWGFLRDRVFSFSMVLMVAFMLLVSLIISAALAAVGTLFGDWQTSIVGHVVQVLVDLIVITLLFALIYRFLPDAKIAWKDVWLGALVTAVLFIVGKLLIGLYLGHSGVRSAFGAFGSLAVLLVWLYYASQIFLFGAEFTKAYAEQRGSRVTPTENAQPVAPQARAEQGLRPRKAKKQGAR